ncbi:MAG: hypothetical protein R2727_11135 [Bacteroidales bacterium]
MGHIETVKEAAGIEIGMERFLVQGGFKAFTTTFEDLHGLETASRSGSSKTYE